MIERKRFTIKLDEAPAMWTPFFFSVLSFMQAAGEGSRQGPGDSLEAVFERASKESNLDGAGSVLSSLVSDESRLRSAFSKSVVLDERSVYILFDGNWGSRARVAWKDHKAWHRILVESTSTKPELIRSVIRADRYETYLRNRSSGGAATINIFPFFSYSPYADDLVETFIEVLRKTTTRPAKEIVFLDRFVLVTAEEAEVDLLQIWQMLCGACDRLDLMDKATTKNWRGRFPELDNWFKENRPYILWDNIESRIRIDDKAKELGRPTRRASRSIPELKPPWLSVDALKRPAPPEAGKRK